MPDRSKGSAAVASSGSMLEIEWDGTDSVICRLGGVTIASAPSLGALAAALERWSASTTNEPQLVARVDYEFEFSVQDVGELVSSRPF